ncbi:MAG TPA: hypothetical protein VK624_19900 [Steroidobacteraceae bacterium]|nr:hypothetical protein [Steroidobacteraceae bacterium]
MRRTALVGFCLLLVAALGVVFTRAVAERVPEQRATLEKLIAERTGLAVRFDNVHFAWGLDGTSAVFTRVELTDPKAGRVRVVAPELRVEFDTWDFMRHHQFSLGHVTLSSPDIEIIGDPEDSLISSAMLDPGPAGHATGRRDDEAALVRRYLSWAELMPTGRIEVEAARVHLIRRGERAARSNFTLSQAVISRGATTFNAYGTMLLAQDVGQSLFVSAKLEGLGATSKPSGDLRLIARRVFLDKLSLPGVNGRGTLDARLHLKDGKVDSGKWQASARELELNDDNARFDHLTVSGTLARDADDVLLNFTDLQLTRGARLERAPNVSARLTFAPGSTHIARSTVRADRLPFMAAEFIAGVLAPQLNEALPAAPGGWIPSAGELHAVRFDSGPRLKSADAWTFSAQLSGADLARASDGARISQLVARVRFDARQLELIFDPAVAATLRMSAKEPRPLMLAGHLAMSTNPQAPSWRFDAFNLRSNDATLSLDGAWGDEPSAASPLAIRVANLDRTLLSDTWTLLAPDAAPPALFAEVAQGNVVEGTLQLVKARDVADAHGVNWQRSSGKLTFAQLATSGKDAPRLTAGEGALEFARGSTQLRLSAGEIEQLTLTGARLDWPRTGAPRMQATLEGALAAPLLRSVFKDQGLERLTGKVAIEADARGERELRQPELWRVAARIDAATVPLAGGLPAVEALSGTLRYGNRQLRALALTGTWLGGPVEIELRRGPPSSGTGRGLNFGVSGAADAAPLLQLLGHAAVAGSVDGQLAWSGSAQRLAGNDAWQISLASNLGGIESRLPEPFAKLRARQLPVSAQLRVEAGGVREFEIDGDRVKVNGQVEGAVTSAHFVVQGIAGDLRRAGSGDPQLEVDKLDLKRAPALLAAAGALLPQDGDLALTVGDLRYSQRSLGALHAAIARRAGGVEFSIESPQAALHQLTAQGRCDLNDVCRAQFTADTSHLAALLGSVTLPAEWPTQTLHAAGELDWPLRATDLTRALTGRFDLETQGEDSNHQLLANATLADGQIQLANVQGSGPASDQVFRGTGRVSLVARDYDLTVDYEQVALAAAAVPTPARARVTRAWNALRGSVARRGWTEAPQTRRVQWHGSWEGDRPD